MHTDKDWRWTDACAILRDNKPTAAAATCQSASGSGHSRLALSETALARHIERDDAQPTTDPWVRDRITLCALESSHVLAAAHLLRYGDGPEIGPTYCGVGEISWFLAQPDRADAATAVLADAGEHMAHWAVSRIHGWGSGLPAGPLWGVPDVWPHVAVALESVGYPW